MKILRLSLFTLLLWTFAMAQSARAEEAEKIPQPVADALRMIERGNAREALSALTPMVRQDSSFTEAQRGMSWNTIGMAYLTLDRLDEARRSLEASIHILSALPGQKEETASALNNLGAVEEAAGHLHEAKVLRLKALRLDREIANHTGAAIAASNLANLALTQHHLSVARKFDLQAFDEAGQTRDIDMDNVAAMYSVRGAIARSSGSLADAVEDYQRAIASETKICPTGCPRLGILYSLRAESNTMLKAYPQATEDYRRALSMVTPNTQDYFRIELSYASMLRGAGSLSDATRLEDNAHTGLESLRGRSCSSCTISAESLR
jgi:tetratricopeptide (TPR) repeat protein